MKMNLNRMIECGIAMAMAFASLPAVAQPVVTFSKAAAKVEDVRDDLKLAIEAKGMVVDHESRIGKMLERTAKDLGASETIYTDALALQFCSASLSRKMMQADPANVVFCPYTIVVYATAARPDVVNVAYRPPMRPDASPASRAVLGEVDALLKGLAREAVGR